jgi:hypothetical protein
MPHAKESNKMAARKSVLKPAPPRPELDRLLAASIQAGVTDEQLQEQRISFAYGNAPDGSRITKESARVAARSIRIRQG